MAIIILRPDINEEIDEPLKVYCDSVWLQWFGYKEEDKGYYAGIIASAMFAGRATGR